MAVRSLIVGTRRQISRSKSGASTLLRILRWKNVCSDARCSANCRSTNEGLRSADDMSMPENAPKTHNLNIYSDIRDLEVSISQPRDSLSIDRPIHRRVDFENRRRIDGVGTRRGSGEPRSPALRGAGDAVWWVRFTSTPVPAVRARRLDSTGICGLPMDQSSIFGSTVRTRRRGHFG
jgi:hypothetical protein